MFPTPGTDQSSGDIRVVNLSTGRVSSESVSMFITYLFIYFIDFVKDTEKGLEKLK